MLPHHLFIHMTREGFIGALVVTVSIAPILLRLLHVIIMGSPLPPLPHYDLKPFPGMASWGADAHAIM